MQYKEIAKGSDIKRPTRLAIRLPVHLFARCLDGVGTVQARRGPDVDCVRYWNRLIYAISTRGRGGAHYMLVNRPLFGGGNTRRESGGGHALVPERLYHPLESAPEAIWPL